MALINKNYIEELRSETDKLISLMNIMYWIIKQLLKDKTQKLTAWTRK